MLQFADTLRIATPGRGLIEITRVVVDWLRSRQVRIGLLTLFCQHTSAGLLIQENAARDVRADLETFFERIAPEEAGRYRHADEGNDDMPAHIERAARHPDHRRPARLGNLARHISIRTSTRAEKTRDGDASDRGMKQQIAA